MAGYRLVIDPVVVLEDGSQRGAANRFVSQDIDFARGATTAAPPLDTVTGTVKFNTAGAVTATKLTQPGFVESTIEL